MSNKTLLIVERSENKLNLISEGEDKYVLEGTFTEIGVKNNNNRIYDEKEILPHVNELKKQCENNKLLGELDHPKSFDISLKNASHVIESIDYDPSTKKVTGRIRLLNTDAGKNARALVDAGVPLHISSRAAGVVESNGHVKIKKMFTYDLVANPGFSNAELKRVNESYGFDAEDDNIGLFEVPDFWTFASNKIAENKENTLEPENKKINEMDAKKYISVEDFNEYTKIIKNEFENLKTSVQEASSNKEDKSLNEGLVKYAESIAKKVNSIQEHIGRLTENVDGLVSHNDYIIENLEKVKNYAELVGEKTNVGINYSEQLAESMDHLIEYTKMVAEKTNESINYTQYLGEKTSSLIDFSNYLAEETSNRWGYQTHINEQLDKVISHNDYIVEGVDSVVKYSEYLKENTENLSNYLNFVVEQINEGASVEDIKKSTDIITEKAKEIKQISESLTVDNNDDFKSDITNQLNAILESAKTEKETETDKKYHFFQFLGEAKRREFDSLNAETQEKIVNAFQTNRYYGTSDANKIWEGCFIQATKKADWLLQMPARYLASWNTLTESQKNSIKAQASTRLLESQYQIDNFWATRDLREVKVDLINENENENLNAPINESSEYKTPDTYMDSVRAGFRQRFKK
jgi:methyl-accepting chemotaxis protein